MAIGDAFQPQGQTVSLTTSGSASTAQSRQILVTNLGFPAGTPFPPNVRIVNRGTSDIWVSFTIATATIVIPTPGTSTVGTPQPALIIIPGSVELWSFDAGPTLWVNDISTGVSQTYHLVFGEGI
jgi:hypothetical protein